jgi:hypothetical protein
MPLDLNKLESYVNLYISSGTYREMDVLPTKGYSHRIIQKISNPTFVSTSLNNRTYSWEHTSIIFLENGKMSAFGKGYYVQFDTYVFQAAFGNRIHSFVFNNDYTEFTATRHDDGYIVKGKCISI